MAAPLAVLLIDVFNPLDFSGAERLLPQALGAVERIAALTWREPSRPTRVHPSTSTSNGMETAPIHQ